MARVQQDQVIDEEEGEACPLCIEEFDLSDRNFRPCPCGFQICQFCYNNIKNIHNGLCPGCRRPYDDKSIQWKVPSADEMASFREGQAQQQKKKAAARQKEAQKREADTLSRKHLSGIRVRQKNLVYVTGLRPSIPEEQLVAALRTDQYFGQYGKIVKIVVSKAKDTSHHQQSVGVYITFARKEDAASCIQAVDGMQNGDTKLRAQYGTTKYCSSYLRNETCHNRQCMFLHEPGEENESFTRQDLSSFNVISTQSPPQSSSSAAPHLQSQAPPQQAPQLIAAASQPMERQDSKDATLSPVDSSDGSALPSTASWAHRSAQSPRASQVASAATPSPLVSNSVPMPLGNDAHRPASQMSKDRSTGHSLLILQQPPRARETRLLDKTGSAMLKQLLMAENLTYVFDESIASEQELDLWKAYPPFFDPNGGAKRQMMKNQEEERMARKNDNQVALTLSAVNMDESAEGGSTQLGGEPEERPELDLDQHQQIPIQAPALDSDTSPAFDLGHSHSPSNDFPTPPFSGRAPLPLQQQQHLLQQFKPASPNNANQTPGSQLVQSQSFSRNSQFDGTTSGHARQTSRFSFANDTSSASASVKPVANPKLMSQQSSMMPPAHSNHFSQSAGNQYFSSSVQGPPPGLKTTGTPPVSGGGMFGQGHGFATAGLAYSANSAVRNNYEEMMRDQYRNRGGSMGSGQMSDAGKREFMFPSFLQHSQTSTPSPGPGLLSFPHGPQPGAFQEHGSQKHKKKGKKHRHANTSSAGGGVVDVADPSILQARMHQAGQAGQGYYNAQGQDLDSIEGDSRSQSRPRVSPFGFEAVAADTQLDVSLNAFHQPPGLGKIELPNVPGLGIAPKPTKVDGNTSKLSGALPEPVSRTRFEQGLFNRIKQSATPAAKSIDENAFPALPKVASAAPMAKETMKHAQNAGVKIQKKESKQAAAVEVQNVDNATPSAIKSEERSKPSRFSEDTKKGKHLERLDTFSARRLASKEDRLSPDVILAEGQAASVEPTGDILMTSSSNSRPATPCTSADTSLKRGSQPKTIKVLATPKAETPPGSATPAGILAARSMSPSVKSPSRKQSVSSLYGPGTPTSERISDTASVTTDNSISRASSPQLGKAAKPRSKIQQKKDAQERAKAVAQEKPNEGSRTAFQEESVVQEPIVGRKKRTKRLTTPATSGSTPAISQPPSPDSKGQLNENQSASPVPAEAPAKRNVAEKASVETEAVAPQAPTTAEAGKSLPFPASALSDLQPSEHFDMASTEFFRSSILTGFKSRNESELPELADAAFQPPLTNTELAKLNAGEPILRGGESGRKSSRVFITPARTCIRGLSKELEDHYLELENRIKASTPPIKYTHRRNAPRENRPADNVPLMAEHMLRDGASTIPLPTKTTAKVIDPAKTNGDEALSYLNQFILPPLPAAGSAGDPTMQNISCAIPRIYTTGEPTYSVYGADVNAVKLGMGHLGMDLPGAPAVKEALANAMGVVSVLGSNEAEEAMLASRKECENLEKRLLGLIKKNKRLAFGSGY